MNNTTVIVCECMSMRVWKHFGCCFMLFLLKNTTNWQQHIHNSFGNRKLLMLFFLRFFVDFLLYVCGAHWTSCVFVVGWSIQILATRSLFGTHNKDIHFNSPHTIHFAEIAFVTLVTACLNENDFFYEEKSERK